MHECPNCGQACDCIGDDTWDDTEAEECQCECEWLEDNEDGWDDDNEDEYDASDWRELGGEG